MPRVRLLHWKAEEAKPLIAKLRAAGFEVVHKPGARDGLNGNFVRDPKAYADAVFTSVAGPAER